jgi:hypothetical protein
MNTDSDTAATRELSQACTALWRANLSLMTAFMHNAAPAHRLLLARRIARNFATLREQETFSSESRQSFARLAQRWGDKADRLAGNDGRSKPGGGLLNLARWFNF